MTTIFVDAEIVKDGTGHLVSKNDLTGTSLEVLSFVPSKIKKRSGSDHSDGRPGRINYHSEDEYRTIRMTVESTAEDMHDIAHLRDAIYDLFDGEFYIREKRITNVEVEYESPGQKTGELQLPEPQYVNGKQIYVAHVGDIEISDDDLQSTFVVEMETVELPYFESIYTTLELHGTGYSSTAEKYGLVDGIDEEKTGYRFPGIAYNKNLLDDSDILYENSVSNIANYPISGSINAGDTVTLSIYGELGERRTSFGVYNTTASGAEDLFSVVFPHDYNSELGAYVVTAPWPVGTSESLRVFQQPSSVTSASRIERIKLEKGNTHTPYEDPGDTPVLFNVYNAGNVTIEPESMYIIIQISNASSSGNLTLKNLTTGETFKYTEPISNRHIRLSGMNVYEGSYNGLRNSNKGFLSLLAGDNQFEISGVAFSEVWFDFKYYYK